jgi:hypothetical protein
LNHFYPDETQAHSSSLANGSGSFAVSRNHVPVINMDQLYMQVCAAHHLYQLSIQETMDVVDRYVCADFHCDLS